MLIGNVFQIFGALKAASPLFLTCIHGMWRGLTLPDLKTQTLPLEMQ